MRGTRLFVVAVMTWCGAALAQTTPDRITFNARLSDTLGAPISGSHALSFGLFNVPTGGTAGWTESYPAANFTTEGLVFLELGSTSALTPAILDGTKLYLEVTVDGTPMTPRVGIVSVPYAIRANEAARVGSFTAAQLQQRVAGVCAVGSAVRVINVDGTVVCQLASGGGGITSITTNANSGLQGGGPGPALTMGLSNCAVGQILKSTGVSTWGCAADNGQTYSGVDFLVNGTGAQAASFNINGTGVIGGNTQIGFTAVQPTARFTARGAGAVSGTGVVSGSATTFTMTGFGTAFTTEMVVGDRIIANGQIRTIRAIASATSATVDIAWPADFFNVTFTIQKGIVGFQNSAGTTVWALDAVGNVVRGSPQLPIEVRDSRAGCPGAQAANTDLVVAAFTLTKPTTILVEGAMIGLTQNSAGRDDLSIAIDGVVQAEACLLNAQGGDGWGKCYVSQMVTLNTGAHTASIRGNTPNVWGCGGTWGYVRVTEP